MMSWNDYRKYGIFIFKHTVLTFVRNDRGKPRKHQSAGLRVEIRSRGFQNTNHAC
jgi:hypothetical protein